MAVLCSGVSVVPMTSLQASWPVRIKSRTLSAAMFAECQSLEVGTVWRYGTTASTSCRVRSKGRPFLVSSGCCRPAGARPKRGGRGSNRTDRNKANKAWHRSHGADYLTYLHVSDWSLMSATRTRRGSRTVKNCEIAMPIMALLTYRILVTHHHQMRVALRVS